MCTAVQARSPHTISTPTTCSAVALPRQGAEELGTEKTGRSGAVGASRRSFAGLAPVELHSPPPPLLPLRPRRRTEAEDAKKAEKANEAAAEQPHRETRTERALARPPLRSFQFLRSSTPWSLKHTFTPLRHSALLRRPHITVTTSATEKRPDLRDRILPSIPFSRCNSSKQPFLESPIQKMEAAGGVYLYSVTLQQPRLTFQGLFNG